MKKEDKYLVNGVEVNPISRGVKNRHELDMLIERAAEESPPVLPTIEELNAWNPIDHDEYVKWLIEERKQRMETTGISSTSNHSHMATTLVHFNLLASMEKNILDLDGVRCIDMARMSGWATSGKIRNG